MTDKDHMEIGGHRYISSRSAAKSFGYTQDYVGQLARGGHVEARRIGGMWYVSLDALSAYKKTAAAYIPQPPAIVPVLDDKNDLSTAQAAELTGYTQDYITQLARSGTIPSKQVGGRWIVGREDVLKHKKEKNALLAAVQSEAVGIQRKRNTESSGGVGAVAATPYYRYYSQESRDLMPRLDGTVRTHAHEGVAEDARRAVLRTLRVHAKRRTLRSFAAPLIGIVATVTLLIGVGLSSMQLTPTFASRGGVGIREVAAVAALSEHVLDVVERFAVPDVVFTRSE